MLALSVFCISLFALSRPTNWLTNVSRHFNLKCYFLDPWTDKFYSLPLPMWYHVGEYRIIMHRLQELRQHNIEMGDWDIRELLLKHLKWKKQLSCSHCILRLSASTILLWLILAIKAITLQVFCKCVCSKKYINV